MGSPYSARRPAGQRGNLRGTPPSLRPTSTGQREPHTAAGAVGVHGPGTHMAGAGCLSWRRAAAGLQGGPQPWGGPGRTRLALSHTMQYCIFSTCLNVSLTNTRGESCHPKNPYVCLNPVRPEDACARHPRGLSRCCLKSGTAPPDILRLHRSQSVSGPKSRRTCMFNSVCWSHQIKAPSGTRNVTTGARGNSACSSAGV